ncbi:MAG: nucleotidyltransferase family protein [Candidatus Omnitrophota bacterium]
MNALILAAGYATRLYPLTIDRPKPLLAVNKRPIVEHIIERVVTLDGLEKIFVVTNRKFFMNFKNWSKNFYCSKPLEIINDKTTQNSTRLGAIGDMALAISEKNIDDDLLVVAGDNLFDFALEEFIEFAKNNGPAIGAYDLKDIKKAARFGVVSLDESKKITSFQEKPPQPKSSIIALAIYFFPKRTLPYINEYLNSSSKNDAPGYYIDWLSRKESVFGYVFNGTWYDIGDIASYKLARKDWARRVL